MKRLILFFGLFITSTQLLAGQIILLNGTSCAGKTTLSKHLERHLGKKCVVVEVDEIATGLYSTYEKTAKVDRNAVDKEALQLAVSSAKSHAKDKAIVILDAIIFDADVMKQLRADGALTVLVYASPGVLCARNTERCNDLQRTKKKDLRATEFVLHCYQRLYKNTDRSVDAIDTIGVNDLMRFQGSVSQECLMNMLKHFFPNSVQRCCTHVVPAVDHDLVIDSSKLSVHQSVRLVEELLLSE